MRKILGIMILVWFVSFPNPSFGIDAKWSCNNVNGNNATCFLLLAKNKELTKYLGAIAEAEYRGQTSNNLPNGKGEVIFNYTKINNSNEGLVKQGLANKYKEGIFKTSKNDHMTILITGVRKLLNGTEIFYKDEEVYKIKYSTGTFEGKFLKDNGLFFPQFLEGKVYEKNGDIFEGSYVLEGDLNYRSNGTYLFKSGEKFIGSFYKSGLFKEGTTYYVNGDRYRGTFFDAINIVERRKTGNYYYANGQIDKIQNGKTKNKKITQAKKKPKNKSYKNSEDGFIKSFLLSWVFAGLLWVIIIFYFEVLGSIGKITKKIDKKIPGTQDFAFLIGGAVTWYLAWSLLFGFEAALLINFVFIYLGVWGSITIFFLNIITSSMKGKAEIYVSLFLGACSLVLAVEMIGPFIKFLKNL
jgi:hypothetical protein